MSRLRQWAPVLALRAVELASVLLIVSFGVFMLLALVDGDPAVAALGPDHTPGEYAAARAEMGLNDPLLGRYLSWLGHALTGDFGNSLLPPKVPVMDRISAAFPVSLELAVLGLLIALVLAIPLALWSAYREGGLVDRIVSAATFAILSVPSFLLALLLIAVLVDGLDLFPRSEWVRLFDGLGGNLQHAFLPALTIAMMEMAMFTRILRNDLVTTLGENYILAARAKGRPPWRIMVSDALRPSSFSLVTILGLSIGRLIGSTVIVEFIFGLPGMGKLVIEAATQGNYPIMQGCVLVIAVVYVVTNMFIDLSYGLLDPRTRRVRA